MRATSRGRRGVRPISGFTLIEMVIVILVLLILAALTIAVVGDTINGDRVRGGASQVQNYLAGARDRAIYAASRQENSRETPPAVGVRFLSDPELKISDDPATANVDETVHRAFGSMVFVQESSPMGTFLNVYPSESGGWRASQLDPAGQPIEKGPLKDVRSVKQLIQRGLLGSRMEPSNPVSGAAVRTRVYYLPVYFDHDASQEPYMIRFVDAPASPAGPKSGSLGGPGNQWLAEGFLSKGLPNASTQEPCKLRLLPSTVPSEEPRILPRGTVIDVESSVVAGTQVQDLLRDDGSFDVMFNARGVVEGSLAAAGLIHLVVADGEDVERGFRVVRPTTPPTFGGPFVNVDGATGWDDVDGDGNFDERQGDLFIVSVRTQTGSVFVSDLNPEFDSATGLFTDPFLYAEAGGEAR